MSKSNEMQAYLAEKKAQAAQANRNFFITEQGDKVYTNLIPKKPMNCHYIGVQKDDNNKPTPFAMGFGAAKTSGRTHHDYNVAYAKM